MLKRPCALARLAKSAARSHWPTPSAQFQHLASWGAAGGQQRSGLRSLLSLCALTASNGGAAIGQAWALPHLPLGAASLADRQQQLATSTGACSPAAAPRQAVRLDGLRSAPGSSRPRKRWGRGNAGDRGRYCGRGVKGQKARKGGKPHLMFDGGQNTMKKFPKVWVKPSSPVLYRQLGLSKLQRWVRVGLLDPGELITMKDLRDSGCVSKTIRWGVELVANGSERLEQPLHVQVSACSPEAKALVEAAGGSVTRVYYTPLGLRALLKPERWELRGRLLPRPVRAWPPRENGRFDTIGQIPPPRQLPAVTDLAAAAGA